VIAIENAGCLDSVRNERGNCRSHSTIAPAQDAWCRPKLARSQLTPASRMKSRIHSTSSKFFRTVAELIDELNDVLKPAALDDKTREEIDETHAYAKGNLEKVCSTAARRLHRQEHAAAFA